LEEIIELESIYHAITDYVNSLPDLDTMFTKLKHAVLKRVESETRNLNWISNTFKILISNKILSRMGKREDYQLAHAEIARILSHMKTRAQGLTGILNLMNSHANLYSNEKNLLALRSLNKYIMDIRQIEPLINNDLFCTFSDAYFMTPILKNEGIVVLSLALYDIFKVWKWILLLHEIGHIIYPYYKSKLVSKFRNRILPLLNETVPRGYEQQASVLIKLWEREWLEEIFSDLYATSLGGLAYTKAFIIEAYSGEVSEGTQFHPALIARVYSQMEYISNSSSGAISQQLNDTKTAWNRFVQSLSETEYPYPFTIDVLDEIVNMFTELVGKPRYLDYINDITTISLEADKIERKSPLRLIIALNLSSSKYDSEVNQKILKVIAEDR